MTLQRRELPKVQPERLRKARAAKKPRRPEGFPAEVESLVEARSGGICELDGCGRATVHHHRRPRGNGGTSLVWVNRAANDLHLSRACHEERVEKHRHLSYVNGWLVSLNATAVSADVPVLYRGRWVLLRDDGSVRPLEGDSWDESEVLS